MKYHYNRKNIANNDTETIQHLRKLLPKMSDESVIVIYLRFWESMTIAEISRHLGESWEYTNNLIEQTLLMLRGELQKTNKQLQLLVA